MIKSFLKFYLRSLLKNKRSTFINIFGLVVSLTCAIVIYQKIAYETGFDRFQTNYDSTYRIVRQTKGLGLNLKEGELECATGVFGGMPSAIKSEIPELNEVVPVFPQNGMQMVVIRDSDQAKNQKFTFEKAVLTTPEYFSIFDYPTTNFKWLYGSPQESLTEPFSAVVTQELGTKLFGNENPIGQSLQMGDLNFKITGLVSELPENTDFPFELFISYSSLEKVNPASTRNWGGLGGLECYVTLDPSQKELVEQKIKAVYAQHGSKEEVENRIFKLQPLKDIHSDTRYSNFNGRVVGTDTLITLGVIGLFLLIMACANYANLSLARSSYWMRAVGIRKTLGGKRWHVFAQFFGESVLLTSISSVIALLLSYLVIKSFSGMITIPVGFSLSYSLPFITGFVLLLLIVSLLNSSYPSLVLSASRPVDLLKNKHTVSSKGISVFTKSMVIVQFSISLLLIIGTITVFHQYRYLTNSDMGFDKEAIFTVPIPQNNRTLANRFQTALLENPAIDQVSFSSTSPAKGGNWTDISVFEEGHETSVVSQIVTVDTSFVKTYGLKLVAGSNFSEADTSNHILVNEELARQLNFKTAEDAVGKEVVLYHDANSQKFIAGVVKDYHYDNFYNKIRPTFLLPDANRPQMAGIKIARNSHLSRFDQIQQALAFTEKTWKSIYKDEIYNYQFIEDLIYSYYVNEKNASMLISIFALITIFIACLGIFGLALYSSQQRSKEIGIRKINGAKISEVMTMLNRDFIKWVMIAFVIATPMAWYVMNRWLENFAYKTTLSWWIFALAGLLALGIALLTVSWQSWKAATRNPVEALRYE